MSSPLVGGPYSAFIPGAAWIYAPEEHQNLDPEIRLMSVLRRASELNLIPAYWGAASAERFIEHRRRLQRAIANCCPRQTWFEEGQAMLKRLPNRPKRTEVDQNQAMRITETMSEARSKFVRIHGGEVYRTLRERAGKPLRVEDLAYAAGESFPGLVRSGQSVFNNKLLQPRRAITAPSRRARTGESSDLSISAEAAAQGAEDDVHSTGSM